MIGRQLPAQPGFGWWVHLGLELVSVSATVGAALHQMQALRLAARYTEACTTALGASYPSQGKPASPTTSTITSHTTHLECAGEH